MGSRSLRVCWGILVFVAKRVREGPPTALSDESQRLSGIELKLPEEDRVENRGRGQQRHRLRRMERDVTRAYRGFGRRQDRRR